MVTLIFLSYLPAVISRDMTSNISIYLILVINDGKGAAIIFVLPYELSRRLAEVKWGAYIEVDQRRQGVGAQNPCPPSARLDNIFP